MHERLVWEKKFYEIVSKGPNKGKATDLWKTWEAINRLYNQYLANNAIEGTTVTLKMIK